MIAPDFPLHLIIPALIIICCLGVIFSRRQKLLLGQIDHRWSWRCLTAFLLIYLVILIFVIYQDISLDLNLKSFDVDENGTFTNDEITPKQQEAMRKVSLDTGRNFAYLTGLLYSAIIVWPVFVFGILTKRLSSRNR